MKCEAMKAARMILAVLVLGFGGQTAVGCYVRVKDVEAAKGCPTPISNCPHCGKPLKSQ